MKLINWDIKENYKDFFKREFDKISKAKSLAENNLTYELKFYHYGSRVEFYLDGVLYMSTDGDLLLNCEVFRLNHNCSIWTKLLNSSKRTS